MTTKPSYIDKLATRIQSSIDLGAVDDEDLLLYRIYAVLLLAKGKNVTSEDVHNAWAVWACEHEPDSRNLVPFKDLPEDVQHKDDPYAEIIRRIAEQLQINE